MFVECLRSVQMDNGSSAGSSAFTKGHIYEAFVERGIIVVIADDLGGEHEISDMTGTADPWFQQRFKKSFGRGSRRAHEAYERAMKGV